MRNYFIIYLLFLIILSGCMPPDLSSEIGFKVINNNGTLWQYEYDWEKGKIIVDSYFVLDVNVFASVVDLRINNFGTDTLNFSSENLKISSKYFTHEIEKTSEPSITSIPPGKERRMSYTFYNRIAPDYKGRDITNLLFMDTLTVNFENFKVDGKEIPAVKLVTFEKPEIR